MSYASLISIILPVYNGEKFLIQAIQSCLHQTHENFELIIVDDASTDNSLAIAREFQSKDERVRIILNKKNLSLPGSLNEGHKIAKGKYITWTSDDNILKPDFLSSLYTTLVKENCEVVFSNYDIIKFNGTHKREHISGPLSRLILGNSIGASFLYEKKVFQKLGGYNLNLFLVEDYDFFLRASLKFRFHHLEKNLYQYRLHENSLTQNINKSEHYQSIHRQNLRNTFDNIGKIIPLREPTINLLLNLYFNIPEAHKLYFAHYKIIKQDIVSYQKKLKLKERESSLYYLEDAVRQNLVNNKKAQTLKNLLNILINHHSFLFGKNSDKKASLRIIYLCLKW